MRRNFKQSNWTFVGFTGAFAVVAGTGACGGAFFSLAMYQNATGPPAGYTTYFNAASATPTLGFDNMPASVNVTVEEVSLKLTIGNPNANAGVQNTNRFRVIYGYTKIPETWISSTGAAFGTNCLSLGCPNLSDILSDIATAPRQMVASYVLGDRLRGDWKILSDRTIYQRRDQGYMQYRFFKKGIRWLFRYQLTDQVHNNLNLDGCPANWVPFIWMFTDATGADNLAYSGQMRCRYVVH